MIGLLRTAWRSLPMDVRRVAGNGLRRSAQPFMARRLPAADPRCDGPSQSALIIGLFRGSLGLTRAAVLLERELVAAGVPVGIQDVTREAGATEAQDVRFVPRDPSPDAAAILAVNPDTLLLGRAGLDVLRGRRVIGFWFYELEAAPRRWRAVEPAVHEIWTSSAFSAAALRSVFDRPVRVAPLAAALDARAPPTAADRAAARRRFGLPEDTFVAVSSFSAASSLARKNPFGAIAAFEAAFGDRRDVRLVLRCLDADRYPTAALALRRAVQASAANVTLINRPGGRDDMHALNCAADVYLSLHRSEGFGLNLAEAMLAERAVIATAWSGNMDFMDAESAALVEASLTPVKDPQRIYKGAGARWAEPSLDEAVAHLRRLEREPGHRATLAARGRAMVLARLSGGAAAQALRRV